MSKPPLTGTKKVKKKIAPTQKSDAVPNGKLEREIKSRMKEEQAAYINELRTTAGGAWDEVKFVELTNLHHKELKERRESFSLVYWTDSAGHCFYPKWQFDDNLMVLPYVTKILGRLKTHETTHVLTKFLVPAIGDNGESVLDLLRSGRGEEALAFVGDDQESN